MEILRQSVVTLLLSVAMAHLVNPTQHAIHVQRWLMLIHVFAFLKTAVVTEVLNFPVEMGVVTMVKYA